MAYWTLDTIKWQNFDASKVTPELLSLAKAACLVEHNGYEYARYLGKVFADDAEVCRLSAEWAEEEVQHGRALRKWSEMADPDFDFDRSFNAFTTGYQLPLDVNDSIRGSRSGELIARCIVEIGTSSYYTAIRDFTDEPVLKDIATRIAADEIRHYKMFHVIAQRYLEIEKIGFWKRLGVALGRIAESEDDELAYAYYAAHLKAGDATPPAYTHQTYTNRYAALAFAMYRRTHVERMTVMLFKAIGLKPRSWMNDIATALAWRTLQSKLAKARKADVLGMPALPAAATNDDLALAA